jgi:four helix bundle protein
VKKGRTETGYTGTDIRVRRRVVILCRTLDQTPGVSRTLAKQLLRSGTSIGVNVVEGQGSQIRADFIAKYFNVCKEVRATYIALTIGEYCWFLRNGLL